MINPESFGRGRGSIGRRSVRSPTQCTLKLDITVQPIRYFQILKIKVELMDENDNTPEFQESRIVQQLSETAEAGSGFVIPGAVDPDSNRNGIQSYELAPSNGPFELRMRRTADGETELKVVLKYRLDREYSPVHQVVVTAVDGGSPPKSGTITVDITVLDANDNKPQFTRALYEVRVSEDAPVGTVLLTVEAHDRDEGLNAQVIYEMSTHSATEFGTMFGVGPESGKLYLKTRLDYETVSTYALSIVARDKGVDAVPTYATVAIHVQDVNDNQPTITVNPLTIDGRAEVMENSEAGTFVAHLSVTDDDEGDNGRVHCEVSNDRFDLLRIYRSEFKVVTAMPLDREVMNSHDMVVTCSDSGQPGLSSTANLTVSVADDNDHSPRFTTHSYSVTINENNNIGDVVIRVVAQDSDAGKNARITYRIGPEAGKHLSIDPVTGDVKIQTALDYEVIKRLDFEVVAEDGGDPSRTGRTTVRAERPR